MRSPCIFGWLAISLAISVLKICISEADQFVTGEFEGDERQQFLVVGAPTHEPQNSTRQSDGVLDGS